MADDYSQQEGLETLKLINAASIALRLYPEEPAQVTKSIENAYRGVKAYLRKHDMLRFSCLDGHYQLSGVTVGKPTHERLSLLTFNEQLAKMGFAEFILCKGVDRQIFRKILTVFGATPEQIQKAGGSRRYVENLGVSEIFPEKYVASGDSEEELAQKQKANDTLKFLAVDLVRPEHLHFLFGRKKGTKLKKLLLKKFQVPDDGARITATAIYSLLQICRKSHVVVVTPLFPLLLGRVADIIQEADQETEAEIADKVVALLLPVLGEDSVLILLCQDFSSNLGRYIYTSLARNIATKTLVRVFGRMNTRQKNAANDPSAATSQQRILVNGYTRFLQTPRGKQFIAAGSIQGALANTEKGRKKQRVQVGIMALADGNLQSLQNREVYLSFPVTIEKLLANNKESVAAIILQNVVNGLQTEKGVLRSCLIAGIGGVTAKLAELQRWDWLQKLTPVSLAWICEAEQADKKLESYLTSMQAMMIHAWEVGNNDLAERILDLFYAIRSGSLEKDSSIRQMVGRIQDKNVKKFVLQAYLDRCFVKPVEESLCFRIIMQGPVAASFLLEKLILSEKRSDRIRLLKLLSEAGTELVPVLLQRLSDPMPWYGKRNIIRLLTELAEEKDTALILEYGGHEDLRVQQEVLQCIVRTGKKFTARYLLKILPLVAIKMKSPIVKALSRVADASIVTPLVELLEDCKSYQGSVTKSIPLEICHALGASGTVRALNVLQSLVHDPVKQFGESVVQAAEDAIYRIREKENRIRKLKKPKMMTKVQLKRIEEAVTCTPITHYPEEVEVYSLLKKGRKEEAIEMLLELIHKTARRKKFTDAGILRERLMEIDSMALAQIIKAAEYIEDARSEAIDKEHIAIWSELYDLFETEEFNEFYHALVHENHEVESTIVQQGDKQSRLFFVNSGRVKLYYFENGREVLVKILGPGEIFGGSSFFSDSFWTISGTAMSNVAIATLATEKLEEWKETYLSIEPKLLDYCLQHDYIAEFFQASGVDRRIDKRYLIPGDVSLELLDLAERFSESSIHGEANDISEGGLSCIARITRRKDARLLLGRRVMAFVESEGQEEAVSIQGVVVAVQNLNSLALGRSVHIRFDDKLTTDRVIGLSDDS